MFVFEEKWDLGTLSKLKQFFLLVLSRCHPNPCYNGGVCHDHASEYECICADGFMGKTCQGIDQMN